MNLNRKEVKQALKKYPDGRSLPNQNTILIKTCYYFIRYAKLQ